MADIVDNGGKIELTIASSDEELFVRRDKMVQSHGTVSISVAVPSPLSALLPRLVNRCYVMQALSSGADSSSVTLTCPGGRQLLGINLKEKERLAVSFSHVIGFSKQLGLASFANLSVAAFACDRTFATIATGPGMLILETNGNHIVHTDGSRVLDGAQLVAWDPRTRFKLDRVYTLADLYLNRVRISFALTQGLLPLVIDSSPNLASRAGNPLLAFLKTVYWPRIY